MEEERVKAREKENKDSEKPIGERLEEKLYKIPMIYVIAGAAASALAICLLTAIIMLICGFGYRAEVLEGGSEVRYFGVMRDGAPSFGWLRFEDGTKGFVAGGKIKYSDGSRYEGGLSGFYYNGNGRYTDSNGDVYVGSFSEGKLHGEVRIEYADGGQFNGTYVGGLCEGYGESVHKGESGEWGYKGEYAAGEENGYGIYIYPDGSVYEGYFKDGMRHGQGKYRFASGDTYTGEFRNNVITGSGSYMFYNSGRVFSGEFVNGIPVFE